MEGMATQPHHYRMALSPCPFVTFLPSQDLCNSFVAFGSTTSFLEIYKEIPAVCEAIAKAVADKKAEAICCCAVIPRLCLQVFLLGLRRRTL